MDYNYPTEREVAEQPTEPEDFVMPPPEEERDVDSVGIIKALSPKKVLEQLRMNLKGYFWDYAEKKYIKVEGFEPLMNDKGIAKYLSIMSSVVTDLITFSNYRPDEIDKLVLYVCDKAIPTIHINYKEYGIKEKSDLQIIDLQIFNLTLGAFKKAVHGGDRRVVSGTVAERMETRSGNYMPQQNKPRGFLSRMNPFAGN